MSLNQIIENGQLAATEVGIDNNLLSLAIISLCAMLMFVALAKGAQSTNAENIYYICTLISAIIAIGVSITLIAQNTPDNEKTTTENIEQWKIDEAYPYIRKQTSERRDVLSIEETENTVGENPVYKIKYKDDTGIIRITTAPASIINDLAPGDTPEVVLYELTDDLGNGLDAGIYGLTVHTQKKGSDSK